MQTQSVPMTQSKPKSSGGGVIILDLPD